MTNINIFKKNKDMLHAYELSELEQLLMDANITIKKQLSRAK